MDKFLFLLKRSFVIFLSNFLPDVEKRRALRKKFNLVTVISCKSVNSYIADDILKQINNVSNDELVAKNYKFNGGGGLPFWVF